MNGVIKSFLQTSSSPGQLLLSTVHIRDEMANPSLSKSGGDPGITPLSPSHIQQSDTDQVQSGPSFVVVVAIDFGTTSSGYAYAFTKEPECIHTMRWANTAMQKLIGVKPGEWDESRKAQYYPVDSVLKQFTDI
ncbi:hypothetical protein AMECASPLE_032724 [Ameca splendens]|uniref:Uncharacterized protein n=1 Tax=Ameca splendens TaxID=208324 RepID=A0ABV0YI38_9TELE